jgi:AcrR family transcriptional regulator
VRALECERMSVATLTLDESRSITRELVLDSAMAIFYRDGFHQASSHTIAEQGRHACEEAGFLRSAAHVNFDSKDDLFFALLNREVPRKLQLVAGSVIKTDSAIDAAQAVRVYYHRYLIDPGWNLLLAEFATHAARNPEIARRYREVDQQLRTIGFDLIARSFVRVQLPLSQGPAAHEVFAVLRAAGCGRV